MRLRSLLIIAIVVTCVAAGKRTPAGPTGTFTNLTFNEDGGDLLGIEVKIVPSRSGYQAVVLVSDGEPSRMVVVDVTVNGRSISFTVPAQSDGVDAWSFEGTITRSVLKGKITHASGVTERVTLPRRCGYWDR